MPTLVSLLSLLICVGLALSSKVSAAPELTIEDHGFDSLGGYRKYVVKTSPRVSSSVNDALDLLVYINPSQKGLPPNAVICVTGAKGGWFQPGEDLYQRLGEDISRGTGLALLRMKYRHPGRLEDSIHDLNNALAFLESQGVINFMLIGHSFGGAVAIQAAALDAQVQALVGIAPQGYGAEPISRLNSRLKLLIVHGDNDHTIPLASSQKLFLKFQGQHKVLEIVPGASHALNDTPDIKAHLRTAVTEFIRKEFVAF